MKTLHGLSCCASFVLTAVLTAYGVCALASTADAEEANAPVHKTTLSTDSNIVVFSQVGISFNPGQGWEQSPRNATLPQGTCFPVLARKHGFLKVLLLPDPDLASAAAAIERV